MIKFILVVIRLNLMILKNKILIFYYNMYYILRFILIFIFIFKNKLYRGIRINLGDEYFSIWLIILRFWIIGLMVIRLGERGDYVIKLMIINRLILILLIFFLSLDLIVFYLIFEVSLIPTFFLILYWGRNPERLSASYYLILYILLISFPLLVYVFKIYIRRNRFRFVIVVEILGLEVISFWGYIIIFIAFYIKIPIYFFHVWLPKAHVEAPVYGSIILAGVLLKMGRYGLIRLIELFIKSRVNFRYLILSIRIVGRVLVSVTCLVQIDIKRLVAYSSVVHINVILGALLTLFKLGTLGAYIIMIAHGLCSSGIFYIVNLYYIRTGSRLLILNKGIIDKMVIISIWWFLLCVTNFSYPFSINFISEIIILGVLVNWDYLIIIFMRLICFFRGAYSLYLFSYVQHGGRFMGENFNGGVLKEYLILFIHVFPLIFILLNLIVFI